jgi:hypothetical protein
VAVIDHAAAEYRARPPGFFPDGASILRADPGRNRERLRPEAVEERAQESRIDHHVIIEQDDHIVPGRPHARVVSARETDVFRQFQQPASEKWSVQAAVRSLLRYRPQ